MFEDAINYPRRRDDALEIVLIGGILGILSVLILPGLVLVGYFIRVYRRVLAGEDEAPPGFGEWRDLLGDGVRALLIGLGYLIVPMALLAVTVGAAAAAIAISVATGGTVAPEVAVAVGGLAAMAALVAVGLLLVAWFLLPAAIAVFVRTDRMSAAFGLGTVVGVASDGTYVTAWVLALVVSLVGSVVAGVLGATVVGAVLSPFVGFYVSVSMAYLYARGAGESAALEKLGEPHGGAPAA